MYTWLYRLIFSDNIFPPTEYNYVFIECNSQKKLMKENGMSIFYGKYLSMLVLMMNLPSILFQLGGNSELTLLDDVKLTFKINSRHKRSYKLSHKIADQNQKSKIKVIGKRNYLQNIQGINGYLG